MANYATLKAAIQNVIKTNGNNEITGSILQQSLLSIINTLGAGFLYNGIATPTTNPGTPDTNVFYLASTPGTYSNFGAIVLNDNEVAILRYNGTWTKDVSGFASSVKVDELNAIINETGVENIATHYGIISASNGVVTPQSQSSYIYTDSIVAGPGTKFRLANNSGLSLNWHRVFFYQDNTFVAFRDLGTTLLSTYVLPTITNQYNNVRFNFAGTSTFPSATSIIVERFLSLSEMLAEMEERITVLESNDVSGEINYINSGSRLATISDISQSISGKFDIRNGSLYGQRLGSDPKTMMIFDEKITCIEFEIASLWDSNLISLCFGIGVDSGNNKACYSICYLPTSSRPNDIGYVRNYDYDGAPSTEQQSSIYGTGHFSGNYRQPQVVPATVSVGDRCRIELINGHFFKGTIYNSTTQNWDWWFCLDANGQWNYPDRYGWNTRKAIGFCVQFWSGNEKKFIDNLKIVSETDKLSYRNLILSKNYPEKRQWVAIGDSITEINKNNGLSYLGFAQRLLNYIVNNQGQGGWTIYRLWRDRATAGWENAVSALNNNDIVTILAGTNDFDTANFPTPASDAAMDAATNPHPRFGTTDPTADDAKDEHTTLGCLRLIIERILTLKPGIKLVVFSPFYREKGSDIGSTGWNKLYINSDGKTIYDYADAITMVGREYNLPSYNTCRECGINSLTLATFTYDDLHIGQLGGELVGQYVAKRL